MAWTPYDSRGRPNTPKSNPKDIAFLAEPLRSRAHQMIVDVPWKGELYVVSGMRDPGTQWDLRDQRVGRSRIWNNAYKGTPTTAVPARWNGTAWTGGSKHQTGEAIDFGGTERAMSWMHDNRERYGLARTVSSERWHMEANRRDTRTGRIHNNPTATIRPYGQTTPKPKPPEDDMYSEEDRKRDEDTHRKVGELYDQWIGTKDKAPTEALRQALRDIGADADAVEKRTRPKG